MTDSVFPDSVFPDRVLGGRGAPAPLFPDLRARAGTLYQAARGLLGGAAAVTEVRTAPAPLSIGAGLRGLTEREAALVGAVADTFFPPGGPIPISGREAGLVSYFDGYLRRSHATQHVLIRLLLAFTELSPVVFGPRPTLFTRLRSEERLAVLDSMFRSRIYFRRVSFISLRALMTMAYLSNDEVTACMGVVADADPFGLRARTTNRSA